MRILLTNHTLATRAGSGLYIRDVACSLLKRGHTPIVYSTKLGAVAEDLRAATVPVIDRLDKLATPPDVIHGQHHVQTMTALLHFSGVPAVFFCHGWLPWEETPPQFPRILRYAAVDETCRDRLVYEQGIPTERVRVILNFVDLKRFLPRRPLPARPSRALVFSNSARDQGYAHAVREACRRRGIAVDVLGLSAGTPTEHPEHLLGQYDLIFAKARCALEALAVGTAVVLCDEAGLGPMVTTSDFDHLRRLNFGIRTLRHRVDAEAVDREIARFDPLDAAEVTRRLRATAGMEAAVDDIAALYEEVLAEHKATVMTDAGAEGRAAAAYLRGLADAVDARVRAGSMVFRLQKRVRRLPLVGALAGYIARRAATSSKP